jgi:putative membrane protein
VFSAIAVSCEDEPPEGDDKNCIPQLNESRFRNIHQQRDAQFLLLASELNLAQIQLGQLAQRKAYHADVKELGKMMVKLHSTSLSHLIELARDKSVFVATSPSANSDNTTSNLNRKTGIRFDKAYCDVIIRNHRKAIEMFETIATNSHSDSDIRKWASATLQELRTHLEYALMCREKI